MKYCPRFMLSLLGLAGLLLMVGCASAEKPDYQGRSGATPKVEDYYPPKAK